MKLLELLDILGFFWICLLAETESTILACFSQELTRSPHPSHVPMPVNCSVTSTRDPTRLVTWARRACCRPWARLDHRRRFEI